MRAALLALLAVLAIVAPASAAPPWSAPDDLSGPHTFIDNVSIGWARHDFGVVAYRWQNGLGAAAVSRERSAARAASGVTIARFLLSPQGRVGDLLAYGQRQAVVAVVRPVGSNRDPRSRLGVQYGFPGPGFDSFRLVVRRPRIASPVLAGNAGGDLALAWFEDRPGAGDRVGVALRPAGRGFGRPLRLATGRVRSVTAAVGARGDVLVAWEARGAIRVRVRRAGSARFGPAETLRSAPAFGASLRAAITSSGRAYVAWSAQRVTEGGERGPATFQAAVRPAGTARFRRAQLLERRGPEQQVGPLDLALGRGGSAVVAWTGERVRAAETGASGRFGAARDLSPAGAQLADAAASPRGARVVVWTANGRVQAAFAAPGEPFGPPEEVSGEGEAAGARAAFAPTWPGPTVAWVGRRADGAVVLRASTREGVAQPG